MPKILNAITNLVSPAALKQKAYKARAKNQGLLSSVEVLAMLDSNQFNLDELQSDSFKMACSSVKLDSSILENADSDGKLVLKDVIIYTEKNFHNLRITEEGYKYLNENQSTYFESDPSFQCVNVNHEVYPESAFGTQDKLTGDSDQGTITADTIELDLNHPAFASQKYALEQDDTVQLGFSIEIGGKAYYDKATKTLWYTEPIITGTATTLVPSAPETLMNMDENQQILAVAEAADESNVVEAGDMVLTANNELMYVSEIIRDSSFTYKEVTCSEADPVALLYNSAYWSWDEKGGNYDFANLSSLTKVTFRFDRTNLDALESKLFKKLAFDKQQLGLKLSETEEAALNPETPTDPEVTTDPVEANEGGDNTTPAEVTPEEVKTDDNGNTDPEPQPKTEELSLNLSEAETKIVSLVTEKLNAEFDSKLMPTLSKLDAVEAKNVELSETVETLLTIIKVQQASTEAIMGNMGKLTELAEKSSRPKNIATF